MIAADAAATNRRKAISNCIDYACSNQVQLLFCFVLVIYRGTSVLLCGVGFKFCCGTAVSTVCVTNTKAFSCSFETFAVFRM